MKRTFLVLGVAGVLTYTVPIIPVEAVSSPNPQTIMTESQTRAAGLINRYSISVSSSSNKVCINGATVTNSKMKSIGYKNISIDYSSDKVNWYKEKSLDDLLKSDSNSYYLNNYTVSVKGGYYYRISCTHYAKESGLFGSFQSVNNTSNSVWID